MVEPNRLGDNPAYSVRTPSLLPIVTSACSVPRYFGTCIFIPSCTWGSIPRREHANAPVQKRGRNGRADGTSGADLEPGLDDIQRMCEDTAREARGDAGDGVAG